MRKNPILLLCAIGAIGIVACVDKPTGLLPETKSSATALHYSSASDPSSQSISVSIGGFPHVSHDSTYTYWANVFGGTGPYTYDWFYSYCTVDPYTCSDQMPLMNAGTDSVPVEIYYPVGKVHLIVEVHDAQTYAFVGAADYKVANLGNPDGTGSSAFRCDLGEGYWPIVDFDGRHYRRNGCTGAREYDPSGG
jgi:hypothetical protein